MVELYAVEITVVEADKMEVASVNRILWPPSIKEHTVRADSPNIVANDRLVADSASALGGFRRKRLLSRQLET